MTQPAIANAYIDAAKIITTARMENVDIDAVWKKLNRVGQYLSATASQLLSDTLN